MTDLVRLNYGYDRAGNRLSRRDEVARSQTPLAKYDELYGYDGLNRLTTFDRGELNGTNNALIGGPTLTQDWTLDATGNWKGFDQTVVSPLTQTRTHNQVNEITDISETVGTAWKTPSYDANGNMTVMPRPGSLAQGYGGTYDAWNRLVKLQTDETTPKTVAEYEYDGVNRRTTKKTYDSSGTLNETRRYYFSDQWQSLEERLDDSTAAERQFVWGARYVDDLVLRDRSTGGGSLNERLYGLHDALFSVVALTNSSGAIQERFAYQPYGESLALNPNFSSYSGSDLKWQQRFTGRELDLESGLQTNRMRYLHLQLGRWCSSDPAGQMAGNGNLYEYALAAPAIRRDPSGLISVPSRDPEVIEYFARVIASLDRHIPYVYRNVIGMDNFIRLVVNNVAPHVTLSSPVGDPTALARYRPFWNTIEYNKPLSKLDPLTALHEAIHALDDFMGWYVTPGRLFSSQRSAEALAWGAADHIFNQDLKPLRDFEDNFIAPKKPCAEVRARWGLIWSTNDSYGLLSKLRLLGVFDGGSGIAYLTNSDYLDIKQKLGLAVSCSALAEAYDFLHDCDLCCPENLPTAFE